MNSSGGPRGAAERTAGYQISRNELPGAKSPIVRDLIADCNELSVFELAHLIPCRHATFYERGLGNTGMDSMDVPRF